jgi:hypothetical protein
MRVRGGGTARRGGPQLAAGLRRTARSLRRRYGDYLAATPGRPEANARIVQLADCSPPRSRPGHGLGTLRWVQAGESVILYGPGRGRQDPHRPRPGHLAVRGRNPKCASSIWHVAVAVCVSDGGKQFGEVVVPGMGGIDIHRAQFDVRLPGSRLREGVLGSDRPADREQKCAQVCEAVPALLRLLGGLGSPCSIQSLHI